METKVEKKSLSVKYTWTQVLFWMAYCCITSFGATYLQAKGYESSFVGIVLFGGSMLSFVLQMPFATLADKTSDHDSLPIIMNCLAIASFICLMIIRFVDIPLVVFAILYILAIAFLDMETPLTNAIYVFYSNHGYRINYEIPRGIGAIAYGVASLLVGYAMKGFGADIMPLISCAFIVLFIITNLTFPKVSKNWDDASVPATDHIEQAQKSAANTSLSLTQFFAKYKWYCISLMGMMMMALFHVSMENYLINIFERVGGDSSNVGVALFIATALEAPTIALSAKILDKVGTYKVWIIIGISFVIKGIIFISAGSIGMIYVGQILQITTYSLIPPAQVRFSNECVGEEDMVKGQSTSTAIYSLGCSLGNLLGGVLIALVGLNSMIAICGGLNILGLLTMIIFVPKAKKSLANTQ